MRRAAAIAAALALDARAGHPARFHPVAGFGRIAARSPADNATLAAKLIEALAGG